MIGFVVLAPQPRRLPAVPPSIALHARAQFEAAFPDKDAPLVVGCLSGKRSAAACDILAGAGYTSLSNVEGGYQGALRCHA